MVAPTQTGAVTLSSAVFKKTFGVVVLAANSPAFVTCADVGYADPLLILIVEDI